MPTKEELSAMLNAAHEDIKQLEYTLADRDEQIQRLWADKVDLSNRIADLEVDASSDRDERRGLLEDIAKLNEKYGAIASNLHLTQITNRALIIYCEALEKKGA